MRLDRVAAADCPECGCNATKLIGAGGTFPRVWARFGCEFCGKEFQIGTNPAVSQEINGVVEVPVRCPKCKSTRVPVGNTQTVGNTKKRHRKCENCGQRFYSTSSIAD